jgi:hypothetical protein
MDIICNTNNFIKHKNFDSNDIYIYLPNECNNKLKYYSNIQQIIFDIFKSIEIETNKNIKKSYDLQNSFYNNESFRGVKVIYGLVLNNNINEKESKFLKALIDKGANVIIFKFELTMTNNATEVNIDELYSINQLMFIVDSNNELSNCTDDYKNKINNAGILLEISDLNHNFY